MKQKEITLPEEKGVTFRSTKTLPDIMPSISITVNGKSYTLEIGKGPMRVDPSDTLSHTLRETLSLTGTKVSCNSGACGSCTVLLNKKAVLSCSILSVDCDGMEIITIEGLADPETGKPDPIQQAFIDHNAFQCGFCTPGMIMTVKALLIENPSPSEEEVKQALSGNFCRCISHYHVIKAIMSIIQN